MGKWVKKGRENESIPDVYIVHIYIYTFHSSFDLYMVIPEKRKKNLGKREKHTEKK